VIRKRDLTVLDRLRRVLQTIGKVTEICEFPDGTRLLLLPYGDRVLGLFPPGGDGNFFWTHPALENERAAQSLYESPGWHNSGGDRTWVAPELDIFFPEYPDTTMHRPPSQLDAADCTCTVEAAKSKARMERRMKLQLARPRCEVELSLAKVVTPAPNPLRCEQGSQEMLKAVRYAGYTQVTSLKLLSSQAKTTLGLWNLLQLPHGGEMLVSTCHKTSPRILFGNPSPEDLLSTGHLVRFKIRASGEHKIAIRAVAATGRAGYLYKSGSEQTLVIRNFFVNPSGTYADCPKDNPDDIGYAFQAVSVDSSLGKFCELEYHVPALSPDIGVTRCDDTSQVWCFRGPPEPVLSLARRLLSQDI
jgi:hypothetical protein